MPRRAFAPHLGLGAGVIQEVLAVVVDARARLGLDDGHEPPALDQPRGQVLVADRGLVERDGLERARDPALPDLDAVAAACVREDVVRIHVCVGLKLARARYGLLASPFFWGGGRQLGFKFWPSPPGS